MDSGQLGSSSSPDSAKHEWRLAYRKTKNDLNGEPNRAGDQFNGIRPKMGRRNRCWSRNSEFHLLPRRTGASSFPRVVGSPRRLPSSKSANVHLRAGADRPGDPKSLRNDKGVGSNVGSSSASAAILGGFDSPPVSPRFFAPALLLTFLILNSYDVATISWRNLVAWRQHSTPPRRISNLGMGSWNRSILRRSKRGLLRVAAPGLLRSLRMRVSQPCCAGGGPGKGWEEYWVLSAFPYAWRDWALMRRFA